MVCPLAPFRGNMVLFNCIQVPEGDLGVFLVYPLAPSRGIRRLIKKDYSVWNFLMGCIIAID